MMKGFTMGLKKLVLASSILVSTLFAGTYNVDSEHTDIGFKVRHMMISNVKGNFNNFSGVFQYDEKSNALKDLEGKIKTSSINTSHKKRDDHLKSADFFDVKKYPYITFKSTKIENDKIYGDITIKGQTKNINLSLENGGTIKDPWGKQRAGFALSGKIKRSDFGLTYNSFLETGGVAIGDIVKFDIEIEGIKKR